MRIFLISVMAIGSVMASLTGWTSWNWHRHWPQPTPTPIPPVSTPTPPSSGSYYTSFANAENPIFESGAWINGGTSGLDWTNVRTVPGEAVGTMPGNAGGAAKYADSTAVLTGNWPSDQSAQATIFVNSTMPGGTFEEVELRLRTTIRAHSITGYEINCSVNQGDGYMQIVRWNGPLGSWTQLNGRTVSGIHTGSVIRATAQGPVITVFLDGQLIMNVTDSTFPSGSPGIGFFLQGTSGINDQYGFSDFSATPL